MSISKESGGAGYEPEEGYWNEQISFSGRQPVVITSPNSERINVAEELRKKDGSLVRRMKRLMWPLFENYMIVASGNERIMAFIDDLNCSSRPLAVQPSYGSGIDTLAYVEGSLGGTLISFSDLGCRFFIGPRNHNHLFDVRNSNFLRQLPQAFPVSQDDVHCMSTITPHDERLLDVFFESYSIERTRGAKLSARRTVQGTQEGVLPMVEILPYGPGRIAKVVTTHDENTAVLKNCDFHQDYVTLDMKVDGCSTLLKVTRRPYWIGSPR